MKKSMKPQEELIFPEHQTYRQRGFARILGLIFRCLIIAFSIFSISFFVSESLSAQIPLAAVVAVSLISAAVGIAMARSKGICLGGIALFSIAVGGFFLFVKDSLDIAANCFYSVANLWQARLFACEYTFEDTLYDLSDFLARREISESSLVFAFFVFSVMVFGIIFSAVTFKKVRSLPTLILTGAPTVFLLYFGMCENALALAFVLSASSALTALACYDNVYTSRKNIKKTIKSQSEIAYTARINSYFGGYIAIAAALLALVISIPMTAIPYSMPDIPQISKPAKRAEAIISASVNGRWNVLSGVFFAGSIPENERSTEAERRAYTGEKVLDVYTETALPVYLRMWTGVDYYEDGWHTASLDRIALYREEFGLGFTSEFLTSELLRAVDSALVTLPEDKKYVSHTALGYITAPVYIDKKVSTSSLVIMPSYGDQKLGFLKYGSLEPDNIGYSNYYDGIFSSTAYMFMDKYGILAQIPHRNDSDFAENVAALIKYFASQAELVKTARAMRLGGYSRKEIESTCQEAHIVGVPLSDGYSLPAGKDSLAYRYIFEMSEEEQLKVDAVLDNLSMYAEYVYENYLSHCEGFAAFEALSEEIIENAGIEQRSGGNITDLDIELRHKTVLAITRYLSDNMTYTLTPTSPNPNREYVNAAETFLFDTKEGYCVQYATAAVMLLRGLGIPARYAEGYVAKNFAAAKEGAPASYVSSVRDSNAHAWVEVFYDNFGWVQYEVTFTDNGDDDSQIHDSDTTSDRDETTTRSDETTKRDEVTSGKEETTSHNISHGDDFPPKTVSSSKIPLIVIICISAALASAVFIVIRRRIVTVNKKYRQFADTVKGTEVCDRSALGRDAGERIMRILKCRGITPADGERWEDFARRADKAVNGISAAILLIRKCEFAADISERELNAIIGCLSRLLSDFVKEKGSVRGAFVKYFVVK